MLIPLANASPRIPHENEPRQKRNAPIPMGLRFATVVARGASARKLGDVGGHVDEPGCSAQTLVGLSVRESVPETRDRLKQSGL